MNAAELLANTLSPGTSFFSLRAGTEPQMARSYRAIELISIPHRLSRRTYA